MNISEKMHECIRRTCACGIIVWECRCRNTPKRQDTVRVCQACQSAVPEAKRDRPLLKWTIEASLTGTAFENLTPDQVDVLKENVAKALFSHINGTIAGVNFTHAHLGVHVALKKEG